jgi:hypothetical protein
VAFGQQAAFDPAFGPVGGIGPGVFPPPRALWSSPRPYSASASQSPSAHQTAPPPPSTASGTPRLPPILGTGHEPWNGDTNRWHLRRPIGSPCVRRKRWHRHTADRGPGAARHQNDACSHASALSLPVPPRGRPRLDNCSLRGVLLPVDGFAAVFLLRS